jgi:hypothetical protein
MAANGVGYSSGVFGGRSLASKSLGWAFVGPVARAVVAWMWDSWFVFPAFYCAVLFQTGYYQREADLKVHRA